MLPPPPASRNSSYAYRPNPSPSISGVWDGQDVHAEGSASRSNATKHISKGSGNGGTLRTPSHVRWPSYASAKSGIPGGYGEMHGRGDSRTSVDFGDDEDEEELDELRAEMMGADDARRAGKARGLEQTLEELGFGKFRVGQWFTPDADDQAHITGDYWCVQPTTYEVGSTHGQALCGFGWMSDNSALQCIGTPA